MPVTFRQIKTEDFEFLWRLHNAALKNYIAQTWGWDENWQKRNFKETFNPNDGKIIVCDGADAGFFWKIEKETEIVLASIRLLPEFQNKGIGAKIIENLIDNSGKPIRLQVLKINPARKLYERLGFEITGETETHFKMENGKTENEVVS